MMQLRHAFFFFLFLGLLITSCDTVTPDPTTSPNAPAMRGGGKLKIKGLESLVTMHDGAIVTEEYFSGTSAGNLKHVRSVTKSVVSLLVGIAIEEGYIGSIDETIGDYLSGIANVNDKGSITIEQLLTMTGGFQWSEIGGNEFGQWIAAGNQIQYVLDKSLAHTPGTYYNYNTGAAHLLGALIAEASGMSLLQFADQYLFGPLGITERAWDTDKQGHYYGGHGVQLKATDMTKLGLLVLQDGAFDGQQVVPANWMQASAQVQWPLDFSYGDLTDVDYGYYWYVDHGTGHEVVLAWGYGGQFVYTVPALNLIVATTAKWSMSEKTKAKQELAILDHIVNTILPAY